MVFTITWAVALLAIGLIVLVGAQMSKGRAQTRKTWTWIGVGGLVIGFIAYSGMVAQLDFLNDPLTGGEGTPVGDSIILTTASSQTTSGGICAVEDTTVTLSATNKYTQAATGGTHRYRVNGAPALTVSDAGTFTASPGDRLEILFMNATSGTYFSELQNVVVPCVGTKTISASIPQNGTLTYDIFNEEGNLFSANAGVNNESLAAEDMVTLEAKLKGTFERGLPYGGVMVVEMNKTVVEDVIVKFNNVENEVSTPSVYDIQHGADSRTRSYEVPTVESNEIIQSSFTIDAAATDPTAIDANDIHITIYANDYYVNEETGGSIEGPSSGDEDDAATFGQVYNDALDLS